MSNEKFYEAVLRDALPISRDFANNGWPRLLYPWFLATVQLPEGDTPTRRAFTLHMGDCIRAGVLPAVQQRIPWFIEKEVVEPHVSAQDFSAWLATEGKEPSPLVREWFKAQGVGNVPIEESIKERNARWLAVKDEEIRNGPKVGAEARAIRLIVSRESVTQATAKHGIQSAGKDRVEAYRAGEAPATKVRKIDANNVFAPIKSRADTAR